MSGAIAPTIGDPRPGFGLRVRLDSTKSTPCADFNCACGHGDGPVNGAHEAESLVVRAGRHMRDECPLPEVRHAAALRYARLSNTKRRK